MKFLVPMGRGGHVKMQDSYDFFVYEEKILVFVGISKKSESSRGSPRATLKIETSRDQTRMK